MHWFLLASAAMAGNLVVEAKVPVEVWVADRMIGELAQPAELHVDAEPGPTKVVLMVGGEPTTLEVDVPAEGSARVLVGRTGITTGQQAAPERGDAAAHRVEFRSSASEALVLVVADDRHTLSPRETLALDLPPGKHPLSLRNQNGTVVWAHGTLIVDGAGLVVQLADGRMPEIAGSGGSFTPDGS